MTPVLVALSEGRRGPPEVLGRAAEGALRTVRNRNADGRRRRGVGGGPVEGWGDRVPGVRGGDAALGPCPTAELAKPRGCGGVEAAAVDLPEVLPDRGEAEDPRAGAGAGAAEAGRRGGGDR